MPKGICCCRGQNQNVIPAKTSTICLTERRCDSPRRVRLDTMDVVINMTHAGLRLYDEQHDRGFPCCVSVMNSLFTPKPGPPNPVNLVDVVYSTKKSCMLKGRDQAI